MLLEVLLGGSDELDGRELEATVLEAGDDRTDEAALFRTMVSIVLLFTFLLGTPLAAHSLGQAMQLPIDSCRERL